MAAPANAGKRLSVRGVPLFQPAGRHSPSGNDLGRFGFSRAAILIFYFVILGCATEACRRSAAKDSLFSRDDLKAGPSVALTAQAQLALPQDDNDMGMADGAAQG